MILSTMKKITPIALGLALLASSAYAATSATATLVTGANSATSSNNVSINGTVKVVGTNTGGYDMTASAIQNLIGPDITRASYKVSPRHRLTAQKAVTPSTYYAGARPSYISHSQGYGWTSGTTTISNP